MAVILVAVTHVVLTNEAVTHVAVTNEALTHETVTHVAVTHVWLELTDVVVHLDEPFDHRSY